jgi:uncharacterized coiled-coil DUF342 family protein
MTADLSRSDIDNLRLAADKAAMNGRGDQARLIHELLDTNEALDQERDELANERGELANERDELRDALKHARGQLEKVKNLCATASDQNALERHSEACLLAEEAIKDIAEALE